MRFPSSLIIAFVFVATFVRAQQAASTDGDADRKKAFLKAREEMRTVPLATPAPAPEATPKPKPKGSAPASSGKSAPDREATPKPKPKPITQLTPRPRSTPLLVITPKPAPVTPAPSKLREAPQPAVTVQKSGFEDAEIVPAEKPSGIWFFGRSPQYKYLTAAVRAEIDRAPVRKGRWRYTVIHNSGTRQGGAKAFDYYHLHVRKMQNGLAYHFVIGNGTSTGDGQIEIGNRWRRQINGGHVHSDYLNNIALGICLVGDFNRDVPTERQKAATEELVTYLRKRVGKIEGKPSVVKAHREINPPRWPTDCPGDKFPYRWLHGKFD